jgi:hypothetical protein
MARAKRPAPKTECLSAKEASTTLHIKMETLANLIEDGVLPKNLPLTKVLAHRKLTLGY